LVLDLVHTVLGQDLVDHDGTPLTRVCYRINTKKDDDDAVVAAYATVSRLAQRAEGGKDDFKRDHDALNDNKAILAMFAACRDPDDPSKPLFAGPGWMREHLDTDTLAGLLNGYNECRAAKTGLPLSIDGEYIRTLRDGCVASYESDLPERVFALFQRETLSHVLAMTCKLWQVERDDAAQLAKDLMAATEDETLKSRCEAFLAAYDAG
jgi:hypothetical protein